MTNSFASSSEPSVVTPRPENSLAYMGSIATFLLSNEVTGGDLSAFSLLARQGSEPPPHIHVRENEMYLVLEGEMEIHVEGEAAPMAAKSGDMVFLPQGKAHAFIYLSEIARVVFFLHSPDGQGTSEAYFRTMAIGPPDSMGLPDNVTKYGDASPAEMRRAIDVGKANGIIALSPEETGQRLPLFEAAMRRHRPKARNDRHYIMDRGNLERSAER